MKAATPLENPVADLPCGVHGISTPGPAVPTPDTLTPLPAPIPAEPQTTSPESQSPLPAIAKSSPPPCIGVLGKVDTLSDLEEADYQTCQAIVAMGSNSFVDVGLAFAQIRDRRLYRVEFPSFEACCQAKWHMAGVTSIA